MIENLQIYNFRGLRNFNMVDARRINVFLGKNNCGKSSILDAFYLLLQPTMPQNFLAINDVRGYHLKGIEDLKVNFYNEQTSEKINISAKICLQYIVKRLKNEYSIPFAP